MLFLPVQHEPVLQQEDQTCLWSFDVFLKKKIKIFTRKKQIETQKREKEIEKNVRQREQERDKERKKEYERIWERE